MTLNLDNLELDPFSFSDTLKVEDIVPEHLRQELMTLRLFEDRSAWRTGDICLEIWKNAQEKNIPVTKMQVCDAVGFYRGLAPHRVMNITHICREFPQEKRTFARPFSYYEKLYYSLPKPGGEDRQEYLLDAMRKSEQIELEEGERPSPQRVASIVGGKDNKPSPEMEFTTCVEDLIPRVVSLKSLRPEKAQEIHAIVEMITRLVET